MFLIVFLLVSFIETYIVCKFISQTISIKRLLTIFT
jgi:hypothetical protein